MWLALGLKGSESIDEVRHIIATQPKWGAACRGEKGSLEDVSRHRTITVHNVSRKQQEVRYGCGHLEGEKWLWPSQCQIVTSLTFSCLELPWLYLSAVGIQEMLPGRRGTWSLACGEALGKSRPLYSASNGCPTSEQLPEGTGSSLPSKPRGDFHLRRLCLPLGSHTTSLLLPRMGSDSPPTFQSGYNLLASCRTLAPSPSLFIPTVPRSQGLTSPLTYKVPLPRWQGHFYPHISKVVHPTPISWQALHLLYNPSKLELKGANQLKWQMRPLRIKEVNNMPNVLSIY